MGKIHAILPNGEVVTNIEVFRRLYEAVGLGWVSDLLAFISSLPLSLSIAYHPHTDKRACRT